MPEDFPFHSFKKVLKRCLLTFFNAVYFARSHEYNLHDFSMGPAYVDLELISFHSVSKGVIGECGRRGGYFECTGVAKAVKEMFYKVASISLCPPTQGQLMVRPSSRGECGRGT